MFSAQVWIIVLAALAVIATGFSVFARWSAFGPAVRHRKLDTLRVGASMDEITALLGRPRERRDGEEGRQLWLYGSRLKRHVLVIEFDATGKMIQFIHGVPSLRKPGNLKED
jgi:outer membrane protein assembly factor BamE (lipoprotein component of BamABCDE complex)